MSGLRGSRAQTPRFANSAMWSVMRRKPVPAPVASPPGQPALRPIRFVSFDAIPHRAVRLAMIGNNHGNIVTLRGEGPGQQRLLELSTAHAQATVFAREYG